MLRKFTWVPVLALALLPAAAHAQFEQGDWTLTLTGAGNSDKDFDATALSFAGQLGYFFTDQIEGNLRQQVSYFGNGDDTFAGTTSVGGDFHFDLDRWQPFVGGFIGYVYGDDVDSSFVVGPEGGVKYFVNSTTYVVVQAAYVFNLDESESDLWSYLLGIGFRW